ncbi:hypothetical protein [Actinomadura rudentiformis]|uniref:hypothetical protein n=1 Tax=Actinomadura rudentiformis TaxID=359158 RepID=UPI00124D3CA9|nr:hypothetical protein [Actinomadura rudentiformis]
MTGKDGSWIEVNCWHCQGTGNEGGQPDPVGPPSQSERRPVGQAAAVEESGLCPQCIGAGEVIGLQEGMRGRVPCPLCHAREEP